VNDDLIHLLTFFSFPFSHQNVQEGLQITVGVRRQISFLADRVKQQAGTAAHAVLLEKQQPLQRAFYWEKMMQRKLDEFEVFF